jgi:hypothetical protein
MHPLVSAFQGLHVTLPFLFLEFTADWSASLLGEYVAALPPGTIGEVSKKLPMGGLLGLVRLEIVGAIPTLEAGFLGVDADGMEGGLEWCPPGIPLEAVLDGDSLWECLCLCLYLCLCVSSVLWPLSMELEKSITWSLALLTELEAALVVVAVSIIKALEKSS